MTILERITDFKKEEVNTQKKWVTENELKECEYFSRKCISFAQSIQNKSGVIAEFKRKSPSKGTINSQSRIEEVAKGYENAGASAISVLTDTQFFGGTKNDLLLARNVTQLPILRKDFMIDSYQITEAKAIGADVILLIAACLSVKQTQELAHYAKSIGLNVFLEIHSEAELNHLNEYIDVIGINNRNLKTFKVDIENSLRLANQLPSNSVKVAESGINDVKNIQIFKKAGFKGFLIGENFMKTDDPGTACKQFIQSI